MGNSKVPCHWKVEDPDAPKYCSSCRHPVTVEVRAGLLFDWWQHYYESIDAHQQWEITSSVISQLSKFASSSVAGRILG